VNGTDDAVRSKPSMAICEKPVLITRELKGSIGISKKHEIIPRAVAFRHR
jgi:hypothetical protein